MCLPLIMDDVIHTPDCVRLFVVARFLDTETFHFYMFFYYPTQKPSFLQRRRKKERKLGSTLHYSSQNVGNNLVQVIVLIVTDNYEGYYTLIPNCNVKLCQTTVLS